MHSLHWTADKSEVTPVDAVRAATHEPTATLVTVVIPCRNEAAHIAEFLDSLLAQERDPDWDLEILVVDGMSDDSTREILSSYAEKTSNIRVLDNPGRIVSTGLNLAIAAARGDVILRMDAHTVYAPDYIRQCVRTLTETGAETVGGPWIPNGKGAVGQAIAAASLLPFCSGGGKAHDPSYEGEVDTVYLGCWHKSLFSWTGMFDPDLVRNQDDEFNFRIRRLGGRVWQSPKIQSRYTPRQTLSGLFRQYSQYGFWRVAVIRKHRALASWRHLIPALFAGSLAILPLAAVLSGIYAGPYLAEVFLKLFIAVVALHFVASVVGSLRILGQIPVRVWGLIPIVMFVHHVSYGLGFLIGVLLPRHQQKSKRNANRFFTALTR